MAYSQLSEDPFGDGPFEVRTQENFQAQQQGFAPASSFQPSGVVQGAEPLAPSKVETAPTFDFGDSLGGLTYTPAVANGHQESAANPPSMISEFPAAQANNGFHCAVLPPGSSGFVPQQPVQQPASTSNTHTTNVNCLPQSGQPAALAPQPAAQPVGAPNLQTTPINHLTQLGFSFSHPAPQTALAALGQPAKAQPPKDKFETKSTVWTDTLNRGLVNLNISGGKCCLVFPCVCGR